MVKFNMDFITGGLAGVGATIITNPMDVVKTRLQLQGELKARHEHVAQYRGVMQTLYVIVKNDGFLAVQKGLGPAMALGFCMNSVRLGTYHVAEVQGWTKYKNGDICLPKTILWSSLGGALSGLVTNPAFVVKTRMQSASHPSIAVGRQHRYKGAWHGITTIFKTEGTRGFFVGTHATCVRVAIGSAAQLTTYSMAKEIILSQGYCAGAPILLSFGASAFSGVAVSLIMCPMDVVTIRLYNQGAATPTGFVYTGIWDCLSKIYKTEGIHGLYKGVGPLYLRIAPHTTLSLVLWDMLNIYFQINDIRSYLNVLFK